MCPIDKTSVQIFMENLDYEKDKILCNNEIELDLMSVVLIPSCNLYFIML